MKDDGGGRKHLYLYREAVLLSCLACPQGLDYGPAIDLPHFNLHDVNVQKVADEIPVKSLRPLYEQTIPHGDVCWTGF